MGGWPGRWFAVSVAPDVEGGCWVQAYVGGGELIGRQRVGFGRGWYIRGDVGDVEGCGGPVCLDTRSSKSARGVGG